MFLLKRKLKGSNKGHSHSSTNANKNIEQNKRNKIDDEKGCKVERKRKRKYTK